MYSELAVFILANWRVTGFLHRIREALHLENFRNPLKLMSMNESSLPNKNNTIKILSITN